MNVDDFDFQFPLETIALRPVVPRESAKLLHVTEKEAFGDFQIGDLGHLLTKDDVLVFNNSKVIPARLFGLRNRDGVTAQISITLHLRTALNSWMAFAKPAKRLRCGDEIIFVAENYELIAKVVSKNNDGEVGLVFNQSGAFLDQAIAVLGSLPLPPYIAMRRQVDAQDMTDYQTIYAKVPGAVAAPTAGLHFTQSLMETLARQGTKQAFITLHVGAGTFLPVKVSNSEEHKMHAEIGTISADVAEHLSALKAEGKRIVAVGTTVLRLLESASSVDGRLAAWSSQTNIFIKPGYRFRFVDRLITNFHLPRSTLFMLVCAFSGLEKMHAAYHYAKDHHYRFYSYGDACLLEHLKGRSQFL